MSNTDQNQPTLSAYVKMLFSSSTLSALRATLLAVSPLLAIFGVSGLTPDKVNAWVAYAQTFGTAALAVLALLGVIVPLIVAIIGVLASTVKRQIARVRELADNPQLAGAVAAKALTDATAQLAKSGDVQKSADAVNALVSATIALPQVQTIVTDKATSEAVTDENVVSAKS
jgi:hypothetical protein